MPVLTSTRRPLQIHHRNASFTRRQNLNSSRKFYVRAVGGDSGRISDVTTELILLNSALTLVLGVANQVLYKLALVPMKEYPFFLALVTTLGYLAIYLSILYARYRAGIVTKERVAYLKSRFLLVGLLEALGVVCGMYAGAVLPGPAIPILSQTFLVWQLTLSVFILTNILFESNCRVLIGCCWSCTSRNKDKTVADRVRKLAFVIMECSGSDSNQMLAGIAFVWPVLMVASSAFQAAASVIKEFVFIDAASRLKVHTFYRAFGKVLDIFVVNSFGSGFQGYFCSPFSAFLSNLKGIPFSELPSFLKSGAGCFFNIGNIVSGFAGLLVGLILYNIPRTQKRDTEL
ncbi:hypothetical protein P3L10_021809 [Capsicum annuum]